MTRTLRHAHRSPGRRTRTAAAAGLTLATVLATTLIAGPAHAVAGITDVTDDTSSFNFGPAPSKT